MIKRPKNKNRILAALIALLMVPAVLLPQAEPTHAEEGVSLSVRISMSGDYLPSETFTAELSGGNLETPLSESVTLNNGKKSGEVIFNLGELPLGIYEYTLREIKGDNKDISYDQTEYAYHVMVNNDGSIEQVLINKADESDKPEVAEFSNSYQRSGKDEVRGDPPVSVIKRINGKPGKATEFTFVIDDAGNTAGLAANPMPSGSSGDYAELIISGEGEAEFGDIIFNKEGVYKYLVSELDDGASGYKYDETVYKVSYTVSRDHNGYLVCEREILKNGKTRVSACSFTNYYGKLAHVRKAVNTGDPSFMIPVTAFVISIMLLAAFLLTRRKKDIEKRVQQR